MYLGSPFLKHTSDVKSASCTCVSLEKGPPFRKEAWIPKSDFGSCHFVAEVLRNLNKLLTHCQMKLHKDILHVVDPTLSIL